MNTTSIAPKASVVIAFYNNMDALKLVLKALEDQSTSQFEVLIADDGSKSAVVTELQDYCQQSPLNIQHIWQEDHGFRKNRCLNLAIQASTSPYLIFIDGDCIPQHHFVDDHLSEAQLGACLNGRRADLSEQMSQWLKQSGKPARFMREHATAVLWRYLLGHGKNIEKGFRLPDCLRKWLQKPNKGLVGCNFSLHKQDLLAINGFDERYQAAGTGEDSDVDYRLRLHGITIRSLFFKATQVHLHHPLLPRSSVNDALFAQIQAEAQAWTHYGINKETK